MSQITITQRQEISLMSEKKFKVIMINKYF